MNIVSMGAVISLENQWRRLVLENKEKDVVLVDYDVIAHLFASKCERTFYKCSDGQEFRYAKEAKQHDSNAVRKQAPVPGKEASAAMRQWYNDSLAEQLRGKTVICTMSKGPTFRHYLDPTYKANRKKGDNPWVYNFRQAAWSLAIGKTKGFENNVMAARKFLVSLFPKDTIWAWLPYAEADDLLSYTVDCFSDEGLQLPLIITTDKDLLQTGASVWEPVSKVLMHFEEEATREFTYYQLLVGDSVDGIKGCPGFGPKAFESFWKENNDATARELDLLCTDAYEKSYGTYEEGLKHFRLVKRHITLMRLGDWPEVYYEDVHVSNKDTITGTALTQMAVPVTRFIDELLNP